MKTLPALLSLVTLSGCVLSFSPMDEYEFRVDHTFPIEAWPSERMSLDSDLGTVRVIRTQGPDRLEVVVHERDSGDASLSFEDRRLVLTVKKGGKAAVGDVTLYTTQPLPPLALNTGMGDVVVEGVEIQGDLVANTGMGDVVLAEVTGAEVLTANSGMGEVAARQLKCKRLSMESGMGDVKVSGVEATLAELDTGMGDVDLRSSTFETLEANSGMGDVNAKDSTWKSGSLDTGLGDVSKD